MRVAINAELAGLLPTQNPGSVSKIPTVISPPFVGVGTGVVVVSLQLTTLMSNPNITASGNFVRFHVLIVRNPFCMIVNYFRNGSFNGTVRAGAVPADRNSYRLVTRDNHQQLAVVVSQS